MIRRSLGLLVFLLLALDEVSATKRVLLQDVKVLTLKQGQYTTGRRSSPVPQLSCVGGSAGCALAPHTVQCYNQGSDGDDVQWKCDAELPSSVRFGDVVVSCEGFDYPDDPYILGGSCGLEYRLDYTSGSQGYSDHYGGGTGYHTSKVPSAFSSFLSMVMVVAFIAGILWLCSGNVASGPGAPDSAASGFGGGGGGGGGYPGSGGRYPGGGGGMGWQRPADNPPPYDSNARYRGSSSYDDASCGASSSGGAAAQQPGFWSGMAAGGLLGYLMGGNRGGGYYNRGYGGGGWGTGYNRRPYGGFGGAPSFGGGGGFSAPRTASGFGGTRRR